MIEQIIAQTISGIIINLPWFILIYIGFKVIAKEINYGIEKIPEWLEKWEKIKIREKNIEWATKDRRMSAVRREDEKN